MKRDYKKYLPKLVVAVLCVFFIGGVIWGAISIMSMEGTMVPSIPRESLSPYPDSTEKLIAYLNASIDNALLEKPKLESSENFRIDEDSISTDSEKSIFADTIKQISDNVEEAVEESSDMKSTEYAQSLDDILERLDISASDVISAECRHNYFKCPECDELFDEQHDICPECGSGEKQELNDREYLITIKVAVGSDSYKNNFIIRDSDDAEKIIGNRGDGLLTCNDIVIDIKTAEIFAKVNRLTDKLLNLSVKTGGNVSIPVTFIGNYENLGNITASFDMTDEYNYNVIWPGIDIEADELSIEPGTTEAIKAKLTCDDPTAYEIRWSCSDESIATIDDEGYIKAAKKTSGTFIVTAEFDFNGQTYSDSCKVLVKYSVEELDISNRSLSLAVGESYTLEAKTSPKKSTIKTVTWYTEDESIATVDSNGTVTAVSPGNVIIFAVSDDGYYKSSCKVEVKS